MKKKNRSKVNVFNRQRRIRVETAPLKDFLSRLSSELGVQEDFSVVLVSDTVIKDYNRRYRHNRRPTDVLSFPFYPERWEKKHYLGDLLISVETAHRQKTHTLLIELKILSLHGLLHLLGYDHETDQGEMKALENRLRRKFKLN